MIPKMKNSEKTFFILAIISLFIIIILAPLKFYVFNESYYDAQFKKNDVLVEDKELVIDNLLAFFKGKETLSYFTEKEQSHLVDVRNLFNKFFLMLNISIILFIASSLTLYFLDKKEFVNTKIKILFLSGLSAFAFMALLFLAALNFASIFQSFHQVFFPQGNYLFSESSLLITLFPETFFQSFFLRLLISSVILSFIAMAPQLIKNKFLK